MYKDSIHTLPALTIGNLTKYSSVSAEEGKTYTGQFKNAKALGLEGILPELLKANKDW